MKKINKMKKSKLLAMAVVLLLSSVMSYTPKAEAADIPYASPWAMLYRTPEYQNKYGMVWWQKLGKKQGGDISVRSYYTYGSSVSVEHKYKASNGKTKTVKKTDSSPHDNSTVECFAGGSGKGISTKFYAGAYGINFNKTVKY